MNNTKLPKNVISRYQYIRNKKSNTDILVYTINGELGNQHVLAEANEVSDNVPGFNFWKVKLTGELIKPEYIGKVTRGREYLDEDVDWFKNYERGSLDVVRTNCIKEDKYRVKLTDEFITTRHRYPESLTVTVYNWLRDEHKLPDYNSVREIHKIKRGIIFSTDLFMEKRMYLTVKNKHYIYSNLIDIDSDILHLKNLPTLVEEYDNKDNLLSSIKLSYDQYGIVTEYSKNGEENKAKYIKTEYFDSTSITSYYPLFLEKFELCNNEFIGMIYAKESITITDELYTYTRELLFPEG